MTTTDPHSILVFGGTAAERREAALSLAKESTPFDTQYLERAERKSIGIDDVRQLAKKLTLRPSGKGKKVAIIHEAQDLTEEAQNALLKTLEEPPAHSLLVLTTPVTEALLPTVVSRCQLRELPTKAEIDPASPEYQEIQRELLDLLGKDRGGRLSWCDQNKELLTENPVVRRRLAGWLLALRQLMLDPNYRTEATRLSNWATLGLKILRQLSKTSLSPRMALEYFLLVLPPNWSRTMPANQPA